MIPVHGTKVGTKTVPIIRSTVLIIKHLRALILPSLSSVQTSSRNPVHFTLENPLHFFLGKTERQVHEVPI